MRYEKLRPEKNAFVCLWLQLLYAQVLGCLKLSRYSSRKLLTVNSFLHKEFARGKWRMPTFLYFKDQFAAVFHKLNPVYKISDFVFCLLQHKWFRLGKNEERIHASRGSKGFSKPLNSLSYLCLDYGRCCKKKKCTTSLCGVCLVISI